MKYQDKKLEDMPTQTAKCEIHGDFIQKMMPNLTKPGFFGTSRCPGCIKQAEIDKQEHDRQQAEYAMQRHVRDCITSLQKSIPPRFQDCSFANYQATCKGSQSALKAAQSYVAKFVDIGAKGAGLIFCGKLGTGKTHLAISIAKEIAKQGSQVKYINLLDLIRKVRSSWKDDSGLSETQILKIIADFDLLVIDEIGVQNGTENERTILFDIINSRYENMVPTIIISNLAIDEIKQLISERSVDRITDGGGGTIVFNWNSYRNRGAA